MSELYVGIDVSQDRLDIATSDGRELHFGNDEAGHRQLCEWLAPEQPQLIVMCGTGNPLRRANRRTRPGSSPRHDTSPSSEDSNSSCMVVY